MNSQFILSILMFSFLLNINVEATIINVPADYPDIQLGIDAAQSGDTVWVQSGEYFESPVLKANIYLLGSGYETTSINGEGIGSFPLGNVVMIGGSGTTIEGFTIENANLAPTNNLGAGIDGNLFSFTARNNRIRNCRVGIRVYGSESGDTVIEKNIVQDNPGLCGICVSQPDSPTPISPLVINNTVINSNRGITFINNAVPEVINNIVMHNVLGISSFDGDIAVIRFNNVYENGQDYYLIPNKTGIEGNISTDPLFVNETMGDFNLTENSPCIDMGDDSSALDPDLTRADMGALYFPQAVNGIFDDRKAINELVVFPNPTSGLINLADDNNEIRGFDRYEIHNNWGQKVMEGANEGTPINLDWLSSGLYVLTVYAKEEVYIGKVLKN